MNTEITSERYQRLVALFEAACERRVQARAAFLDEACAGDDALRREVDELLAADRKSGGLLENSLAALAPAVAGTQIGPYRIEAKLGEGGMGVVYRALDTKLNRPVAIKFLYDDLADAAGRRRFQREAQMASSLNHPHILTVHDAGEFEGRQYLVTEYIDGGTLKDWARADKRAWWQIVELLMGVADGLATAHAASILHRDIKPDNILITGSGYAKLSDFGLAKLAEDRVPQESTEGRTNPGTVLGTIAYMSPEQASGRQVDARSDVFSFGVLLYELLAGRRPFAGATDLELLQTIIHGTLPPLGKDVPIALRTLVKKTLEKDPAERYPSMRAIVTDLRRLLHQSAETPTPQSPARRIGWAAAAVLMALAFAAGSALIVWRLQRPAVPARLEYTQLTNFTDSAVSPALSPDGRLLAFIRGNDPFVARGQIYIKSLPDGEPVQLTHDNLMKRGSPKFSPDGTRIAYSAFTPGATWDTWVVQVLGGQPRLLLANASGLSWIESGARLLFSELTGRGHQMSIVTSTESRAQHRTVYLPPETGMAHRSYLSPDGKQVLLVEMDHGTWLPCRLTPFDGKSPGRLVGPAPAQCTEAAWSLDGKWMYFSANTGNGFDIWRQRFPDGTPEQITFNVTEEEGIEVHPDGRSLVTSIGVSQSTVWVHDSRGDHQITSEGYALRPSVSPDGKKLYYLLRVGGTRHFVTGELWVADLESGQRRRLLPDFLIQHYAISADGQRVVFVESDDTGNSPMWLAALNGRSVPRLLTTIDSGRASFAAGGYVLFLGQEKGVRFIYRIKEDGSELQKVLRPGAMYFGASPDGKWVMMSPGSTGEMATAAMVYPLDGGSPRRMCTCTAGNPAAMRDGPPGVSWSPDGKFLYLNFQESIYAIPLRPGQMLPMIPASGFRSKEEVAALPGARQIPELGAFPGPNPSIYAFTKVATNRNIYRVSVP